MNDIPLLAHGEPPMSNLEWTGLAIVAVFAYIFVAAVNWWRKIYIKKLDEEKKKLLDEKEYLTKNQENDTASDNDGCVHENKF